jgi:hypothetical protein
MLFLNVALVACAGPAGVIAPNDAKPRAERPTYTLGEKWIRDDGIYELIRVENDRYIFSAGPGHEIHLTKDLTVARVQKGVAIIEFDPPPTLSWPLEVGKWGAHWVTWRNPADARSDRARFFWSIEAYEKVHVPAGTFMAFRIAQRIEPLQPPSLRNLFLRAWYAPEVRQFVKIEATGHTSFEAFQVVAVERPALEALRIALREPTEQQRVTTEGITLSGNVTGGKGVARVSVTLNGQEVSREEEKGAGKPEVTLNVPLRLQEGKNILLVTAADPEGTTRQESRTLFYDKAASQASQPALTPAPTPPPPVASVPPAPPLQVTISSPRDQERLEQESIGLAGMISGGKGVSRVVVTVNGVEVTRHEERTPQRARAVNVPLKLSEGQNTLVLTATEADGTIHQEVRTVHYEKRVPLTVAFKFPEDRARMTDEVSAVAALVTSSKGVSKVSVTLNGVEVHRQSERTPPKSLVVTAPLTFREGVNTIVISAAEPDGTLRQEVRTVNYDKTKVALTPSLPAPVAPTRNRWAVVVGVGRYESPDIPRLRYTVPDAEAVYQVLTGPAGFKPEHVLLLTDRTEKKPTYRNLKWALGTFLARSAQKDDTVVIFFAGHGAPEVDQRGLERDGLAKYLVPSDADPDDLYSTALPMDELQTIFGRIEAERVVVFLDACYSGAAGGRTFTSKKTRSAHLDDLFLERLTRAKGRAIITASRPAEVSLELPELGHGLFTFYILQGLKGAADLNRDGIVSLQELYEYVEQQVSQKSRAVGGNQHPVMKGELEGVLPLVKVGGR